MKAAVASDPKIVRILALHGSRLHLLGRQRPFASQECSNKKNHWDFDYVMPTFICFLNWTEQGVKNAKDASKRNQAAKAMAEKLGGRVLSTYVTTDQYDVVATVEMPSGEAMAKYATAVVASGNARTTTVRAFTPEEFSKLAAEAPTF